jgi:hypothetical protein
MSAPGIQPAPSFSRLLLTNPPKLLHRDGFGTPNVERLPGKVLGIGRASHQPVVDLAPHAAIDYKRAIMAQERGTAGANSFKQLRGLRLKHTTVTKGALWPESAPAADFA